MNVVRLVVLGAIREAGASHGYAIRQILDDWQVQAWTRLHSGSVYYALQQMAKEGILAVGAQEPGDRGPGKTVFSLTEVGESEFLNQLRQALASFDLVELSAGLAFLDSLSAAEARARLTATVSRLTENAESLEKIAANTPRDERAPRTYDLLILWRATLAATASSLREIIKKG